MLNMYFQYMVVARSPNASQLTYWVINVSATNATGQFGPITTADTVKPGPDLINSTPRPQRVCGGCMGKSILQGDEVGRVSGMYRQSCEGLGLSAVVL